jgi:hypothetical protein
MKPHYLALLFILFGCATPTPTETITPSGIKGYTIDCSGGFMTMSKCYQKAAEKCPEGYNIVSKDEDEEGISKSLLISCNGASKTEFRAASPVTPPGHCKKDEDCTSGKTCAPVRGEYPGWCAKKSL